MNDRKILFSIIATLVIKFMNKKVYAFYELHEVICFLLKISLFGLLNQKFEYSLW